MLRKEEMIGLVAEKIQLCHVRALLTSILLDAIESTPFYFAVSLLTSNQAGGMKTQENLSNHNTDSRRSSKFPYRGFNQQGTVCDVITRRTNSIHATLHNLLGVPSRLNLMSRKGEMVGFVGGKV